MVIAGGVNSAWVRRDGALSEDEVGVQVVCVGEVTDDDDEVVGGEGTIGVVDSPHDVRRRLVDGACSDLETGDGLQGGVSSGLVEVHEGVQVRGGRGDGLGEGVEDGTVEEVPLDEPLGDVRAGQ